MEKPFSFQYNPGFKWVAPHRSYSAIVMWSDEITQNLLVILATLQLREA